MIRWDVGYKMKKILVSILILALILVFLPMGVLAEDDTSTPPAAESPLPDESILPSPTPAPTPAPTESAEPSLMPSESPSFVYDIEKARQEYKDTLALINGTPKYAQAMIQNKASDQTMALATADGKSRYTISFKSTTSFEQIQSILQGTTNKMIGSPDNGKYLAVLDDPAAFQQTYGDYILSIEQDKTLLITDSPNDTDYYRQYALPLMNVPDAWNITKGSDSVKVAVIDTGIYRSHEDFSGTSIAAGYDELTDTTGVSTDPYGHGTCVAGVIAATANNSKGIAGICWDVTIVPYKVSDSKGTIYVSDVLDAIYKAADAGCKVINMSLGGEDYTSDELAAINYALGKGCIIVASAGNEAQDGNPYEYPASFEGVISAAAVGPTGAHSYFSNYNDKVDVAAPGENVYTTTKTGSYAYMSGTSFSAPCVTAIAALAAAVKPSITPAEFANLIATTSEDLGPAGYDTSYGYGLIDANALLSQLSVSGNANLSGITVTAGTLSPGFASTTTSYQLKLDTQGSVTITPAKSDPKAVMTIDGVQTESTTAALNYGESRNVTISVTAQSGAGKTYTITVARPLPNGYLSNITLSTQSLSPVFSMYTMNYTVNLPEGVPSVTITPVRTNTVNKMTIDGRTVSYKAVSLLPNKNATVKIMVYETTRITHTYSIYIVRAPSSDATLSRMSVSGGTPDLLFANGTPLYTITVPESKSSASVKLYPSSPYATTYIDDRIASSKTISLSNGQTKTVTVRVHAQAGNEQTFQLCFVRPARISSFSAAPTYQRIPSLSPQGNNTLTFKYSVCGSAETRIEIYKDGVWKRILTRAEGQGSKAYAWDGRVDGEYLAPGTYTAKVYSVYGGTYISSARAININIFDTPDVNTALSTKALAKGQKVTAQISWNAPTNLTIQVIDQSGNVVATLYSGMNCLPASKAVYWYGKNALKAYVAPGTYKIRITAGGTVEETENITVQ